MREILHKDNVLKKPCILHGFYRVLTRSRNKRSLIFPTFLTSTTTHGEAVVVGASRAVITAITAVIR